MTRLFSDLNIIKYLLYKINGKGDEGIGMTVRAITM